MIIRNQGVVVGMIDDSSLNLTESTSIELDTLVKKWKKDGIRVTAAGEGDESGATSSDGEEHILFTADNLAFFRNELLIAGFELQTA